MKFAVVIPHTERDVVLRELANRDPLKKPTYRASSPVIPLQV